MFACLLSETKPPEAIRDPPGAELHPKHLAFGFSFIPQLAALKRHPVNPKPPSHAFNLQGGDKKKPAGAPGAPPQPAAPKSTL